MHTGLLVFELVAVQIVGPLEVELLQDALAAFPHAQAERLTGWQWIWHLGAEREEDRAQEKLDVGTAFGFEGDRVVEDRLAGVFLRLVVQQIWKDGHVVFDVPTEGRGDRLARVWAQNTVRILAIFGVADGWVPQAQPHNQQR